jgi:hypothetical protein
MLCLTLRKKFKLQISENNVFKKIFGPKKFEAEVRNYEQANFTSL